MVNTKDHSYLREWKTKMRKVIRLKYSKKELSDEKLEKYLDKKISDAKEPPKILLVNNYTNSSTSLGLLQLIDVIRSHNLICAGGGCIFLPHGKKRNILIEFIRFIITERGRAKKERKKYDKGTDLWDVWDRAQNGFKLIVNSLYGCLGYPGFALFNIFIAEAITSQGRHIITSAINGIEGFLGDAMWLSEPPEIFNMVEKLHGEFKEVTDKKMEFSNEIMQIFKNELELDNLSSKVADRFLSKCTFSYSPKYRDNVHSLFSNMNNDELLFMYFKNNLAEFNKLSFVSSKLERLVTTNGPLTFCEDYSYKDDICRAYIAELIELYKLFVNYNYPVYDRIRKAMYYDKVVCVYTDTDSVFKVLDFNVKYIRDEIFKDKDSGQTRDELTITAANITLSISNTMVDRSMKTLCRSTNVPDDKAKLLMMKNEFFFPRILFTPVKKRYISLGLMQEGSLLGGGKGLPEIKGFDFMKANTKPRVREAYIQLCLDEILYPEKINPISIFRRVSDFKEEMTKLIKEGSMEFFKQSNVKTIENYARPYSTQGVNAVVLWNALYPEKALSFPVDVNIAPIRSLTYPKPVEKNSGYNYKSPLDIKNIQWFANKYPAEYRHLDDSIYSNHNKLITHMNLTSIAIPKNIDYEIPQHIIDLIDIDKIVVDAINLIIPILKCVGINSYQPSADREYMSNMITL